MMAETSLEDISKIYDQVCFENCLCKDQSFLNLLGDCFKQNVTPVEHVSPSAGYEKHLLVLNCIRQFTFVVSKTKQKRVRICKQRYEILKYVVQTSSSYLKSYLYSKDEHLSFAAKKIIINLVLLSQDNTFMNTFLQEPLDIPEKGKLFETLSELIDLDPKLKSETNDLKKQDVDCENMINFSGFNSDSPNLSILIYEKCKDWLNQKSNLIDHKEYLKLWGNVLRSLFRLDESLSINDQNLSQLEPTLCSTCSSEHCRLIFVIFYTILSPRENTFLTYQIQAAEIMAVYVETRKIFKTNLQVGNKSFGGTPVVSKLSEYDLGQIRLISLTILNALSALCRGGSSCQIHVERIRRMLLILDEWIKNALHAETVGANLEWFVTLFIDEDDLIVEALQCCTEVYTTSSDRKQTESHIANPYCPHLLFTTFLKNISNDHEVLIDFLTSNETKMLLYLVRYLKLVASEWESFVFVLHECESNENLLQDTMDMLIRLRLALQRLQAQGLIPYNIKPLLRRLEYCEEKFESMNDERA